MVDRYIDTDVDGGAGTGVDWANAYATAALWEAGEQASLSDDHTGHFRASSGTADGKVTISGWTLNGYMSYMTNEDGSSGYWDITKYRMAGTGRVYLLEENIHIKHFQIESTDDDPLEFSISVQSNISIEATICLGNAVDTFGGLFNGGTSGTTGSIVRIWNCIFYDGTANGKPGVHLGDFDVTFYVFNNTFHNNNWGIRLSGTTAQYCRNNRIAGVNAWHGTFTDDDDFNDYNFIVENENNVANGSNGAYNQTFIYEDEGNDKFAPATGDPCIDAGDDLSSHGVCPVTDDILGVARDASNPTVGAHEFTDGAFEYVASGGVVTSGTGLYEVGYIYEVSGGAVTSGTGLYEVGYIYDITGGAITSGAGEYETGYIYEVSGSAITSGTGLYEVGYIYEVSGGAVTSGIAEGIEIGYIYDVSGGIVMGGAADYESDAGFVYEGSGSAITGGSGEYEVSYVYDISGGIITSGTGEYGLFFAYISSGSAITSGAGEYEVNYIYNVSGGAVTSGIGEYIANYIYDVSGGIIIAGYANYYLDLGLEVRTRKLSLYLTLRI